MSHPLTSYDILVIETATRLLAARYTQSAAPIPSDEMSQAILEAKELIFRATSK